MQATVRRQVEFVFALCEISEPWTATVSSPRVWKNQLHQTVKTDGSFMALQRWESSITFCVNHGCQISFFFPPRGVISAQIDCETFAAVLRFISGSGQVPPAVHLSLFTRSTQRLTEQRGNRRDSRTDTVHFEIKVGVAWFRNDAQPQQWGENGSDIPVFNLKKNH